MDWFPVNGYREWLGSAEVVFFDILLNALLGLIKILPGLAEKAEGCAVSAVGHIPQQIRERSMKQVNLPHRRVQVTAAVILA